ncbi:MAG: hypothetical protein ACRDRJ_37970, partial [Streptosporangiaceae bacterium]
MPDLDLLAATIAGRLRQHGSVLICDHHPLWEVLTVRGENLLTVTSDYFGRGRPRNPPDDAKRPAGARGQADPPAFAAFVWPVSDVVMSLVRAGLRLEEFFEGAEPAIYPDLGDAARHIPAHYVIKATKTGQPARHRDSSPGVLAHRARRAHHAPSGGISRPTGRVVMKGRRSIIAVGAAVMLGTTGALVV